MIRYNNIVGKNKKKKTRLKTEKLQILNIFISFPLTDFIATAFAITGNYRSCI